MSYEPTTWKDGDLVTSAKLNKLEQGVVNSSRILIAHIIESEETSTLDKTWQEIHDADVCYIIYRNDEYSVCSLVAETSIYDGKYTVNVINFIALPQVYAADSSSDYPILQANSVIKPGSGSTPM